MPLFRDDPDLWVVCRLQASIRFSTVTTVCCLWRTFHVKCLYSSTQTVFRERCECTLETKNSIFRLPLCLLGSDTSRARKYVLRNLHKFCSRPKRVKRSLNASRLTKLSLMGSRPSFKSGTNGRACFRKGGWCVDFVQWNTGKQFEL